MSEALLNEKVSLQSSQYSLQTRRAKFYALQWMAGSALSLGNITATNPCFQNTNSTRTVGPLPLFHAHSIQSRRRLWCRLLCPPLPAARVACVCWLGLWCWPRVGGMRQRTTNLLSLILYDATNAQHSLSDAHLSCPSSKPVRKQKPFDNSLSEPRPFRSVLSRTIHIFNETRMIDSMVLLFSPLPECFPSPMRSLGVRMPF